MNTQTNQQTIKIGVDPGFGNFKIAWLKDGQIQTRVIPSVAGIGKIIDLSRVGLGPQRKQVRPLTVTFGDNGQGISYLVGPDVHSHTEPIEDLSHTRLSEGLLNRCLMYAALGQAVNGHPVRADLMIGLPVEIMRDKESARSHLQTVRSWLAGPHRFCVDDRPVTVSIEQIRPAAQPLGAYFDWGMNERGEWGREQEALKKPVAVCDVGYNTLDLFAVENGNIVARYTDGDDLGMHRVSRAVQRHLRDHYELNWGLHQADDLVREHLAGRPARVYCAAGEVHLGGVVEQALQQTFTAINEFIAARWDNGRQFYKLIMVGGGAAALRSQFLRHYPTALIPPDPVTTNVRGLLKRAQLVFK